MSTFVQVYLYQFVTYKGKVHEVTECVWIAKDNCLVQFLVECVPGILAGCSPDDFLYHHTLLHVHTIFISECYAIEDEHFYSHSNDKFLQVSWNQVQQ